MDAIFRKIILGICLVLAIYIRPCMLTKNLALGKPATQIGTWGGHGAEKAVDGNRNQNDCAYPRSQSEGVSEAAWWKIDLTSGDSSKSFVIENVTIYFASNSSYVCPPSKWGENCLLDCTIDCYYACNDVTGKHCKECESGYFGKGCISRCNCLQLKEVCAPRTGRCWSGGCAVGYHGSNCSIANSTLRQISTTPRHATPNAQPSASVIGSRSQASSTPWQISTTESTSLDFQPSASTTGTASEDPKQGWKLETSLPVVIIGTVAPILVIILAFGIFLRIKKKREVTSNGSQATPSKREVSPTHDNGARANDDGYMIPAPVQGNGVGANDDGYTILAAVQGNGVAANDDGYMIPAPVPGNGARTTDDGYMIPAPVEGNGDPHLYEKLDVYEEIH